MVRVYFLVGWPVRGELARRGKKERRERREDWSVAELMIKIMMTTPVMRRRRRRSRRWWRVDGGGGYLLLNERTPAVAVDDVGGGREAARVQESPLVFDRRFEDPADGRRGIHRTRPE